LTKDKHYMTTSSGNMLSSAEAQSLAIEALSFLATEPEHLGRFLAASGLGPQTLREAAADAAFLVGVLEFLMADEAILLAFSEISGTRPTMIAAARFTLSRAIGDRDG
jgi:hypothetical protein